MLTQERSQFIILSIIFGIVALASALIWWPFLRLLVMAGILSVLFWPLYAHLEKKMLSAPMAAITTILIQVFIFILPMAVLGQLLFGELTGLYGSLRDAHINQAQILEKLPVQFQPFAADFLSDLGNKAGSFADNVFSGLSLALSSAAGVLLSVFLMFFTVYYFLRDGQKIRDFANAILPMSETKENVLVNKLSEAITGVVKGSFLVALVQGLVATAGFIIFRVPNPFLWGSFTVLAALVPSVGTSLSLIPAVIYLFLVGRVGAAVGFAIWGALAVGLIDNIVSPKLVGAQTKLHPLLVLFSVLGGIRLFGFIGFLLGPIVMAMFVALLEIYRVDLEKYLEK
ncbi:MAG: AI-2E family transporter [Candidatus Doudnabacteria bacterium]|nr:AI-2E family transporter [Candidatus Doudnabacteria bacterium]